MNLSKREKILLMVLAFLLVLVGLFMFVIDPLYKSIDDKRTELSTLDAQKIEIDGIKNNTTLEQAYRDAIENAKNNYDSFYSTLNSYTIDKIINGLMEEYGLHVQTMQISPYATASQQKILGEDQSGSQASGDTEQENLLMLSTVDLVTTGSYQHIKEFVDALNQKSFCLQVGNLQIDFGVENQYNDEARLSASIYIFGIALPDSDLDLV